MPIYIYECPMCKKQEELFQTQYAAQHLYNSCTCKDCRIPMRRIIAPTNFVLKGDGWAKDGYDKKAKEI